MGEVTIAIHVTIDVTPICLIFNGLSLLLKPNPFCVSRSLIRKKGGRTDSAPTETIPLINLILCV